MKCRALILDENLSVPFDRRVWRESTALRDAGYQVTVICPRGRGGFDREFRAVEGGVRIYRFPSVELSEGILGYGLEYGWALLAMGFLTLWVHVRRGFDVIQMCNPPDLLFLIALPYRWLGKKVIFDHHDLSAGTYRAKKGEAASPAVVRALEWLQNLTFRFSDLVMSTNESYRAVAIRSGEVDPENVVVVRNGPELSRFTGVEPDPSLKHDKDLLGFYVGNMGPQDGVDYLLRAAAILRRRRDDFRIVLVGGGSDLNRLQHLARELHLEDCAHFTGRIPDTELLALLATADVCFSPDPKNPLNDHSTMNKTMEYMVMSKPVVAFDLVETRVSAGDAALYASDNDIEEYARHMERLFDSPDLRRQLGQEGRRRIEEGLSWEHSTVHLLRAYERALTA